MQHNVLGEGKEKARRRALAYWMKAFDQDGDGKIPIERLIKTTPPHRLFHRISIYVRTVFRWDRASFMLASRQSFIGSASAPRQLRTRFALLPRQLRVGFASKPQNTCCERLRRGASRASGIRSRRSPPMPSRRFGSTSLSRLEPPKRSARESSARDPSNAGSYQSRFNREAPLARYRRCRTASPHRLT